MDNSSSVCFALGEGVVIAFWGSRVVAWLDFGFPSLGASVALAWLAREMFHIVRRCNIRLRSKLAHKCLASSSQVDLPLSTQNNNFDWIHPPTTTKHQFSLKKAQMIL